MKQELITLAMQALLFSPVLFVLFVPFFIWRDERKHNSTRNTRRK